eukprot:CCRYP_008392-RA/>CCRYP_008392-RA protein AED:0.20 eAED:1.00 QI:0/-1/0/1/-1/0/1/0/77
MEAEVIALAHCCRELFPIMDMVSLLGTKVGLPVSGATMNVSIHEDNAGALVLERLSHHSLLQEVSTMPSRQFGFVNR